MNIQGTTYEPIHDEQRLKSQYYQVCGLMLSRCRWWTLGEIEGALGYPQASISARLRDLRKEGFDVQRRRRGNPKLGLFEYRVVRKEAKQERLF